MDPIDPFDQVKPEKDPDDNIIDKVYQRTFSSFKIIIIILIFLFIIVYLGYLIKWVYFGRVRISLNWYPECH